MGEKCNKLHRSKKDVMVGGVCGGLAEQYGLDVSIVRVVVALICFFTGAGFIVYLIFWCCLPVIDVEEENKGSRKEKEEEKKEAGVDDLIDAIVSKKEEPKEAKKNTKKSDFDDFDY